MTSDRLGGHHKPVFREAFVSYAEDGAVGPLPLWQHRTYKNIFSTDGGETYYNLNEDLDPDGNAVIHTSN